MSADDVISGLEVSRRFYSGSGAAILERDFPEFVHAASRPRLWRQLGLYDRP